MAELGPRLAKAGVLTLDGNDQKVVSAATPCKYVLLSVPEGGEDVYAGVVTAELGVYIPKRAVASAVDGYQVKVPIHDAFNLIVNGTNTKTLNWAIFV